MEWLQQQVYLATIHIRKKLTIEVWRKYKLFDKILLREGWQTIKYFEGSW